ncbi:4-hydroxyphenylacetate 3-hydroxylase family protein [Alkalihalobacillus pseudalcaliphilus]|uniref:4-hydroxyphenylacetate 3-hydroxylase family protein n=1 Tax=Alkalihalobacillus pseudalcaliphilus TaxID=79884 RepID=UPI00064E0639|nr:4-hydroxyphenylacetate 3-hydroxylase N-terminal domain-containing protein [Alkalihalobacillus pseudalcaliphilus]KMK78213.1 4-hydroxyphenylacetate 3-hydroxylase [Alkalihalobacillus pseudalcaliphilus]
MTRRTFLERVKAERTVWVDGELVQDVTHHPAFEGTIKTIDKLLQKQYVESTKELLTYHTEGVRAHLSFLIPENKVDLKRKRVAYQHWADDTFGVMSRLSEYTRSIITGWYANRDVLDKKRPGFAEKIAHYYRKSLENDWLSTVAGHDPQRDRATKQTHDALLHITDRNEDGIFVSGAKMIATAAPYVDEILINSYHKRTEKERAYAHVFFVPVTAKGLNIVCRESFASQDKTNHPLSSRYDEMDAVLIFDHVFIPWERVLACEDPEFSWVLRIEPCSALLSQHQTVARLVSKLESVAAIANELAEASGATAFLHVKQKLAEVIMQKESIYALLNASEHESTMYEGVCLPDKDYLATARNLGTKYYPRSLEIIQQVGAGGLLQTPSKIEELFGPIAHLLKEPYKGTKMSAEERTKLIKLAWDLIGNSLGSRHELYERFYSGDPVRTFAGQYHSYQDKKSLVDFAYQAIRREE